MLLPFSLASCAQNVQRQSEISIDGGAVGFPLHQAVAEEFLHRYPDAQLSVASSGTGGGMSKFCAGEIDIAGASRPIKDEEIAKCRQQKIDFVELPVTLDGIAIIVNHQNNFAQCLSIEELNTIWSSKSVEKVTNWHQVNPNFPNQKLKLYAPASDTGTFDYFTQAVNRKAKASRTDFTPSHNQNILVQGVEGDANALAYVGISYYLQNQQKLNLVSVKDKAGVCQQPVPTEKIANNIYLPLSRPLFIYVKKQSLDTKPRVREFVNFYLENSKKWVEQSGYVQLPDTAYPKLIQKVAADVTGSKFKDVKPGQPVTNLL